MGEQTETSTKIVEGFKSAEDTRTVWRQRIEDIKNIGGAPSPTPLHPHPSQVPPAAQVGGENPQTSGHWKGHQGQHGTGSQSIAGGRRVTTGATGGDETINEKTDGEEARGGERDARAGKVVVDMELRRGNLGGGREGGNTAITGTNYINPNLGTERSIWVVAVRGLEPTPPYNEHSIWAR